MKSILYIICFTMLIACKGNENTQQGIVKDSVATEISKKQYTCPMHPEIVSDTPATCPRCGMDLELKS